MKYLLLLLVALACLWLWRKRGRLESPSSKQQHIRAPHAMVRCAVCGIHLPQGDAIATRANTFYCQEHGTQHNRP